MRDVAEFMKSHPKVNYRYFFMSSKPLTWGLQEMDFSPAVIDPMIQIGMDDAANVINNTLPGDTFKKFNEWTSNKRNIRAQYPNPADYLYSKEATQ